MGSARNVDSIVRAYAEEQNGLVHRDQLRRAGVSRRQIANRAATGRWVPMGAQAFRLAGAPVTYRQQLRAAVWDAGPAGTISHGSAARLRKVPSFGAFDEVHVLMPRASDHRCSIATVHESRRYDQTRATDLDGIRCVTLPFAVVQIAPSVIPTRIAWIVQELVDDERGDLAALRQAFAVLGPGNGGYEALDSVLDEWSNEDAVAESKLERKYLAAARAHGLPPADQQVTLEFREDASHRVDFVWHEARIIIEVDGRRWHARRSDFHRDHVRDLAAAAAGWQVIHLTWWMLDRDPTDVCNKLLAARNQRQAA